jgi:hypothetical protein
VTELSPGPNTLVFEETIAHTGSPFRIALSRPGEDSYEDCILLNHIPHNDDAVRGVSEYYAITVDIPDIDCESCALQIIQIMTDKIDNNLGTDADSCTYNPDDPLSWSNDQCGSNYHSCANVQITGSQEFSSDLCTQVEGWTFGEQDDMLYFETEDAEWDGMLLVDEDAPSDVRSVSQSSITACSSDLESLGVSVNSGGDGNVIDEGEVNLTAAIIGGVAGIGVAFGITAFYFHRKRSKGQYILS